MAVKKTKRNIAYGLNQPNVDVFPVPIVAERAPTNNDKAEVGTRWIDRSGDDAYVLTSIKSGVPSWVNTGGGSANFSSITATDDITSTNGDISSGGSVSSTTGMTVGNTLTVSAGDVDVTSGSVVLGSAGEGFVLSTGVRVLSDSGDPNGSVTSTQGSLYLRTDGSGTSNRAYINTDGGTTWTSITTAA